MKFSKKIVIGTMLIVVILFSSAGIILIHENFKNSYQLLMKTNLDEHNLDKYSIETNIHENILSTGEINTNQLETYFYTLTTYLGNRKNLGIYINNKKMWNNIPFETNIKKCEKSCIKQHDSKTYSIIKSNISINKENIMIISTYDITDIFKVRNQNLISFYIIDIILIILCGLFTALFAKYLTKPIKILNESTKLVAAGNLDIKTKIKGQDEISELSMSFDKMIESVKKRQNELKLSLKQREDFVSNITHELKTPMTSIMGYAKIWKQNKFNKQDKEKALNYIYSETKRLETLSHKLLELIGLKEEKINFDRINTKKLFKEIKDISTNRFQDINIVLEIKEETVLGDEELLITCIMNLIENAYKASETNKQLKSSGKLF